MSYTYAGKTWVSMSGRTRPLDETVYKRGEILWAINDQPRTKPALTEALDTSRSTINRGVDELEEAGCIERRDSKYYTTLLGELSCTRYRNYRSNMSALDSAKEVVSRLPAAATLSATFLKEADVYPADPAAPEAALQPSIDLLQNAEQLHGFAPVELSLYVDLIHEYATMNGLSVEIIAEEDTLHPILESDKKRLRELASQGDLEIFTGDESLHYALWLMRSSDREDAGATIYENGGIRGVIINSSTKAVEWARNEYERHRESAERRPIAELLDK